MIYTLDDIYHDTLLFVHWNISKLHVAYPIIRMIYITFDKQHIKNYWCEQRISFFSLLVFASVPLCLYFFGIFLSLSLFLSSRSFLNKISYFFSSSSSDSSSPTFQNRWVLHAIRYRSEIFYSLLSSHQKNIWNNFGKLIALLLFFLYSFLCELQTTNNTSVVVCN